MKKLITILIILLAIVLVIAFAFNPDAQTASLYAAPQIANSAIIAFVVLIAAIVTVIALILLFLSKSQYNVFGSGKVVHNVHVEHKYYGNDDDDGEIQWVKRGGNE